MPGRSFRIGFAVAAAIVTAGGAWAAEEGHKPHVHGESKMNLAFEGDIVEIELEAPGFDIVGFESMPKTDDQRAAVKRAMAALGKGETLFRFSAAAGCRLLEAEIETPLAETGEHAHEKHAEEKHAEEKHAHEKHGEEKHAEEEEHSEFHAHYRFRCAQPGGLKAVEILLFDSFRAMREIEVSAILPAGQRAKTLTPGSNRLDF